MCTTDNLTIVPLGCVRGWVNGKEYTWAIRYGSSGETIGASLSMLTNVEERQLFTSAKAFKKSFENQPTIRALRCTFIFESGPKRSAVRYERKFCLSSITLQPEAMGEAEVMTDGVGRQCCHRREAMLIRIRTECDIQPRPGQAHQRENAARRHSSCCAGPYSWLQGYVAIAARWIV